MTRPLIISIEGNIGAGKSTLLERLQKHCEGSSDIVFLREPVDIWEAVRDPADGQNILQKFYGDSAKYSFPFQIMAFMSRLSLIEGAIREHPECSVIVCERSLCADRNIFAKMLSDDGLIESVCYQIYGKMYDEFSSKYVADGIVYVDAEAEVCFRRIAKRGRDGEGGIALDYLEKCKKYHDAWLLGETNTMLHLQTNEDATYEVGDVGHQWLIKVMEFIGEFDRVSSACI
jgi:deoxycitidine kinase/deoxyguanosine kinase